jgi:hypothetical protein
MDTPDNLRARATNARRLANEKTAGGRLKGGSVYLLSLAEHFDRQADLLERAGQKPKQAPPP